ncbi:hypothetical protein AB0H43_05620 [Hamadaea sp. NPDC050747]|uniref:hypothetical protein n=1 Tax=Hamadaea sp. NPDC050747 TaxID=3155789 RepID=UPI0033EB6C48
MTNRLVILVLSTVLVAVTGCDADSTPEVAPAVSAAQAQKADTGEVARQGQINADLSITGDLAARVVGKGGVCDATDWSFISDQDFGVRPRFTFEVEIDSMPKLALNIDGDSYVAFPGSKQGQFEITPEKIRLDADVVSFQGRKSHLKGVLVCERV